MSQVLLVFELEVEILTKYFQLINASYSDSFCGFFFWAV
jgi:hypothetical protein